MKAEIPVATPRAAFLRAKKADLLCHILEHEDNDMMRPYEVVS